MINFLGNGTVDVSIIAIVIISIILGVIKFKSLNKTQQLNFINNEIEKAKSHFLIYVKQTQDELNNPTTEVMIANVIKLFTSSDFYSKLPGYIKGFITVPMMTDWIIKITNDLLDFVEKEIEVSPEPTTVPITGTIIVNYVDELSLAILDTQTYTGLVSDTPLHIVAKEINGYTHALNNKTDEVDILYSEKGTIVTFMYTKII